VPHRVLLISHEPIGEPGLVGQILLERGCETELHVVLADPEHPNTDFPDPAMYDAVMAFGSFSSAYDPAARLWVEPELDLIRGLVADDVPYLGVCFGGQLLAEALGGTGEGWALSEAIFDHAAVLLSFEQVGGAQTVRLAATTIQRRIRRVGSSLHAVR